MSLHHYVPNPMTTRPPIKSQLSADILRQPAAATASGQRHDDATEDFVDVDLQSPDYEQSPPIGSGLGTFQIDEPTRREAFVSVGELDLGIQFGEQGADESVIIVCVHSALNFPAYHGISQFSKHHTKIHLDLSLSFEKASQPVKLKSKTVLASTSMVFDDSLVAIMGTAMFQTRRTLRISMVEKKLSGKKVLGSVDIDISRLSSGRRINRNSYCVLSDQRPPKLSPATGSRRNRSRSSAGVQKLSTHTPPVARASSGSLV